MGIPGYARTIESDSYYKKYKVLSYKLKVKINHLFIDFNSIVYNIFPTIIGKFKTKSQFETLLIKKIIEYLSMLICETVQPNKSVYIAIDGPVPRGKIYEQRKRRFRTLVEDEYKKDIKKKHQIEISNKWIPSKNMIPGTNFMYKLEKGIKTAIKKNLFCAHHNILVVLSSSNNPGEGEHKILPKIRKMKNDKKMKNNKVCIFSPDGDLYPLSIITNKNNIYLMDNKKDNNKVVLDSFKFSNIDNLRKALKEYIPINISTEQYNIDYNLLICFMGNDFVENFIITKSNDSRSIKKINTRYEKIYKRLKEGLVKLNKKNVKINHKFLLELFKEFASSEDFYYKKYYEHKIEKHLLNRANLRNNKSSDNEKTEYEKDISILEHTPICNPNNVFLYKEYLEDFQQINYSLDF